METNENNKDIKQKGTHSLRKYIVSIMLVLMGLGTSLSLISCSDDVPDDITDKLVGTWVLHNNPEITGSYVFLMNGTGYFKAYTSTMDFEWYYISDKKTINMTLEGTSELIESWKIVKFHEDYMTLEDLLWNPADGDTDDPYFRMDKVKN